MVILDNIKTELLSLKDTLNQVKLSCDIERKEERVAELEREMQEPTFWNDVDRANKLSTECKTFKQSIDDVRTLENQFNDILEFIEIAGEEEGMEDEIVSEFEKFKSKLEDMRISMLLSGEHDACNAILRLNAGAGGTESCDWVSILYRMYTRWAEKKGFQVMPELEDDNTVEINPEDLKIDTYRSSGAGGQHINKTSSAVRITHIPTGVVVACQNERSQFQNKDKAMQMLKAKLLMLMEEANAAKLDDIRGEVLENGFGSQIRSYVLQPYTMVKDLRTNEESGNAAAVLDGDLDPFINAYLKWKSLGN